MLGASIGPLGALQLGQIFVAAATPGGDLELCCTTVESLNPVRRTLSLNPERSTEWLGPVRRTKAVC